MAMAKIPSYSWQCELSGAKQRLKHLFKTGCFSDIMIKCPGGFTYQLHRMVLAMSSTVFEAMIFGPMATSNENIWLEDNPEALKYLFEFCYECDFQCNDIQMVLEVFKIADKYMFNDLKSRCVINLRKLIKPENFNMIYEFTLRYGFDDLRNTCIRIMQKDENILTATAVLMWYTKNSPKDLLTPIFTVDKLVFDNWRSPKAVVPSDKLITILQSNCCRDLQEFAGQVSGDVLKFIPGPLISTLTYNHKSNYIPKLKFSLKTDNANEVMSALHKRYEMYGPEDIGIHISNEDIAPLLSMLIKLPCYSCDNNAEEFVSERITLYISDLTEKSFSDLSLLLSSLTPECDKHHIMNSYMFPRCKLKMEDLGTFYRELFYDDEYYLLPLSAIRMYSSFINVVDEAALYDSLNKCMREAAMEISDFIPKLKIMSGDNDIPGW